jgi:hypothetical protein
MTATLRQTLPDKNLLAQQARLAARPDLDEDRSVWERHDVHGVNRSVVERIDEPSTAQALVSEDLVNLFSSSSV